MTIMNNPLFKHLKINHLTVDGRLFKTATAETWATEDGYIGEDYLNYYRPIAWAGTPLIITGNMYVGQSGKGSVRTPGIESDDKIPGLTQFTEMVHGYGSKVVAQINHIGRQCYPQNVGNQEALAPSDVREMTTFTMPRAMTVLEIEHTIDEFANAAKRAQQAGFDGVQVHIAHGYLLSEFLTPHTNRRSDDYGGSFENRLRMPVEVIRAVRQKVGSDYPVLIKLNGADLLQGKGGLDTEELIQIAQALVTEGVDAIEISCSHYESGLPMIRGRFNNLLKTRVKYGLDAKLPLWRRLLLLMLNAPVAWACNKKWPTQEGFNLDFARQFKAALSVPVICVGGFNSDEAMRDAIASDAVDAVSIGRAMVADPLFYKHIKEGVNGPRCDYCNQCVARLGGYGLSCFNPELQGPRSAMLADVIKRV